MRKKICYVYSTGIRDSIGSNPMEKDKMNQEVMMGEGGELVRIKLQGYPDTGT